MFPISDDNPQIMTPYGVYALIMLNVFVWVFVQGLGVDGRDLAGSICQYGLVPAQLFDSSSIVRLPGMGIGCERIVPAWFTPLTSMFMHGGWMHIIGNMWFLWIFGDNVEDVMGTARFIVFYVLCGLAAAALQVIMGPGSEIPMVGASGAIGGVMGAYIVLYPRVNVHMLLVLGFFITRFAMPAIYMLGYWVLIQFISGLLSAGSEGGVAFWAHVGGFAAGAALVFVFRNRLLLMRHPYHGWQRHDLPTDSWRRIRRR